MISIWSIYPTNILFFFFDILFTFSLDFNVMVVIYQYIKFFIDLVNSCVLHYYIMYIYYNLFNNYFYEFYFLNAYFGILIKFFIYFLSFSVSMFKFVGHFFQCFIPFIRYIIKYECFIFLISLDLIRSVINLLLIPIYLFLFFFYTI